MCRVDFPQTTRLKVHARCDQNVRELLDTRVVQIHRFVEEFASIRDLIFKIGNAPLQLPKDASALSSG